MLCTSILNSPLQLHCTLLKEINQPLFFLYLLLFWPLSFLSFTPSLSSFDTAPELTPS